ncbi:MAG: signal peptidase II [Deltaproteobacteria bacterium]
MAGTPEKGRSRPEEEAIRAPSKYVIFGLVACLVFAADQFTKYLVLTHVPLNRGFEIVRGYVDLVHARNPGAAFGIMAGSLWGLRPTFFLLISIAALGIILWMLIRFKDSGLMLILGYAFFFGGAAGNLLDRIRYGEVIDFLDVHVADVHWPAFNVADSALCIGTALFFLHFFIRKPAS